MSLPPAYLGARRRKNDDQAPPVDEPDSNAREDLFNLIPPRANGNTSSFARYEELAPSPPPDIEPPPEPQAKLIGRNRHPVDMTDLSRLSIDNDGRLY